MNKLFFYLIIITSLSFTSCLSIVASVGGLKNKTPKITQIPFKDKEVYFLGMTHLAKEEFYENTKKIIETYQKKGFTFYVENIKNDIEDTLSLKKFRKLTNLDLKIKYSKFDNPYMQKLVDKYKLVDQPKYEIFGLTAYKRVDYGYTELINFYEEKFGTIKLDSCDKNTDIKTKYTCNILAKSARKNFTKQILLEERNKLIVTQIKNSIDNKIVIIYGKKHLKGIETLINN